MKEKAGQSTIKETFALNRQFAGAFSVFFEQKATYHRKFKMQGKRNKRYERHQAGSNDEGKKLQKVVKRQLVERLIDYWFRLFSYPAIQPFAFSPSPSWRTICLFQNILPERFLPQHVIILSFVQRYILGWDEK